MSSAQESDIFDVLESDHRALIELLSESAVGDDALSPSHCERLVMQVVRHFVAEEQYLLPLVRDQLPGGEQASEVAFDQHRVVEDQLRRLEDLEHSADRARPILNEIDVAIRDHINTQHEQLFPALRESCDPSQLRRLADEVLGAEQLAPTRPRAVRPESAAVNKVVSLVAGYVDHARDAYSRRGVDQP